MAHAVVIQVKLDPDTDIEHRYSILNDSVISILNDSVISILNDSVISILNDSVISILNDSVIPEAKALPGFQKGMDERWCRNRDMHRRFRYRSQRQLGGHLADTCRLSRGAQYR